MKRNLTVLAQTIHAYRQASAYKYAHEIDTHKHGPPRPVERPLETGRP